MSEKLPAFLTALLVVCTWGWGLVFVLSLGFMYAGVFPSQELADLIRYGFVLSGLGAMIGSLVVRDPQTKAIRFPVLIGWRRGDDRGRFGVVWREVWRALPLKVPAVLPEGRDLLSGRSCSPLTIAKPTAVIRRQAGPGDAERPPRLPPR